MRPGDLVQYPNMTWCGWAIVIDMHLHWPNIEVLWSDGSVETVDCQFVEVVCEGG